MNYEIPVATLEGILDAVMYWGLMTNRTDRKIYPAWVMEQCAEIMNMNKHIEESRYGYSDYEEKGEALAVYDEQEGYVPSPSIFWNKEDGFFVATIEKKRVHKHGKRKWVT